MRGMRECSANVIPIVLKQKFKKGSFYCPFFYPKQKSAVKFVVKNLNKLIFTQFMVKNNWFASRKSTLKTFTKQN